MPVLAEGRVREKGPVLIDEVHVEAAALEPADDDRR